MSVRPYVHTTQIARSDQRRSDRFFLSLSCLDQSTQFFKRDQDQIRLLQIVFLRPKKKKTQSLRDYCPWLLRQNSLFETIVLGGYHRTVSLRLKTVLDCAIDTLRCISNMSVQHSPVAKPQRDLVPESRYDSDHVNENDDDIIDVAMTEGSVGTDDVEDVANGEPLTPANTRKDQTRPRPCRQANDVRKKYTSQST